MARFCFSSTPIPAGISAEEWSDWTWQLRRGLKSKEDFAAKFTLSPDEERAFDQGKGLFEIRATPYAAALARDFAEDPLRRILMPHARELGEAAQQMVDPLGEKKNNPVPRIVHRYSDRALFLVTDFCSVYCRYCTRKYFTGQEQAFLNKDEYAQALNYLKTHPGIREVILSGGDPLTLSDSILEKVLTDLRAIEHIEIIRIGSRMPVVCPMRITDKLAGILQKANPVYLMLHFNHPREITLESAEALTKLADHGLPMMNQMVLLNGVNNHPALIQALSRRLLYLRVKPYYMFQCDPSMGTDHLRTSIDESLEIQRDLWGHLSGLAMPTFAVDIPDGGGKTVLTPNFEISRTENARQYRGWDGVEAEYVNPPSSQRRIPPDAELYQAEWDLLRRAKTETTHL